MPPVCQHCLSTEVRAVLGLASFPQLQTKQWPRWLKPLRAGGNSLLLGVWWHVVLFTHPGLQHINSAHAFSELFLEEMGEPWALNRQPWAGRGPGWPHSPGPGKPHSTRLAGSCTCVWDWEVPSCRNVGRTEITRVLGSTSH